jgi:sporulation protein YlmC with PRC-barrel domain
MTLQTILNKPVVTSNGDVLGHVYDFRARFDDDGIYVTHMRVGAAAWVFRLGLQRVCRRLVRGMPLLDIPWEAIAAVDSAVTLKPEWDKQRCDTCREQGDKA